MNIKTTLTFVGVTLGILVGVAALLWNFGNASNQPLADVEGDGRLALGNGQVTVVEFSDFQCPACASVQAPLKELLAKFEGRVKLVYRHYPLTSIHPNALSAARAAEAAFNQAKFFEYGDILFSRQSEWSPLEDPTEKYVAYATELGLDVAQFMADMQSESIAERVSKDMVYANRHSLSGTPTFFVDGVKTEFTALEAKLAASIQE